MPGGPRRHELGHCTCRTHVDRPWNRPEHWTSAEVEYLCTWFGLRADATIAKRLGRTVLGIRLKAKRLGLKKKDAGYTASEVGRQLGVDTTTVTKFWIRHGLLRSTRSYPVGLNRVHLLQHSELERFIREHGEQIDHTKVPADSVFAAEVAANRWYSLPQLHRLTGRSNLDNDIRAGLLVARQKTPGRPAGRTPENAWPAAVALDGARVGDPEHPAPAARPCRRERVSARAGPPRPA